MKIMKRLLMTIGCLLLAVQLSSCGMMSANITGAAQNANISYNGLYTPNPEAEAMLVDAFSASTVAWQAGRLSTINNARGTIEGIGNYLKTKVEMDGTLPYYTYKSSFENINFQYNLLQKELDARVEVQGAISDKDKVIYSYVKRDINLMLKLQRQKIADTEKSIEDTASSDTLTEITNIYSAIKPLIDMVL